MESSICVPTDLGSNATLTPVPKKPLEPTPVQAGIINMMNKIIKYEKKIKELKDRVNTAETETALIKATGMNSPEMIAVKKEVCELRQDNRRLSKQVEDSVDRMRKAGVI